MKVYLQPSPVRWLLDSTIEYTRRQEGKMHPIDYALSVRVRLVGTVLVGVIQTIHLFAIWVLLSAASLMTLGIWNRFEWATDRIGSLCGAGLIGAMIAATSLIYIQGADVMTRKITRRADREFKRLCRTFEYAFDREAGELYKKREAAAKETKHPEFHNRAVTAMRYQRQRLRKECVKAYPSDPLNKYVAISSSQARMFKLLSEQRRTLLRVPFTQTEVERDYVDKTKVTADVVIEAIYGHVKTVWAARIAKWGENFPRESYAEQCLKLFKEHRIDDEVESLVEHVKNAVGKKQAYQRFVEDINNLQKRVEKKINKIEEPNIVVRIRWFVRSWFSPST